MGDIDTAVVDSLKVLDPKWPIREADILIVIEIKTLSRIRLLPKVLWVSEVVSSLERADRLRSPREAGSRPAPSANAPARRDAPDR